MPGIIDIYTDFVKDSVRFYHRKGKVEEISRAKLEFQVLNHIDEAEIPLSIKLSWYHAVLASSKFDAYWNSVAKSHNLPKSCTTRYITDHSLLEYKLPVKSEYEEGIRDVCDPEVDDSVNEVFYVESQNKTHNDTYNDTHATEAAVEGISTARLVSTTPSLTMDDQHRQFSPNPSESNSEMSSSKPRIPSERTIPYCDRCKSRGHSTVTCSVNFEPWTIDDWESEASDEYPGGPEDKENNRRLFLNGLLADPHGDRAEIDRVDDWLRGTALTREKFYRIVEAHKNGDDVREKLSSRSKNEVQGREKSIRSSPHGAQDDGAGSRAALGNTNSTACGRPNDEHEALPSTTERICKDKKVPVNDPPPNRSHDINEENRHALGSLKNLAHEGDNGECEKSPFKHKVKAATKNSFSVKSASKPKGIVKKNNASPRTKKQKHVRFSIDPAKMREWARLQLKEESSPIITDVSTPTQALATAEKQTEQVENTETTMQGTKRTLEQVSDGEDEPPAAKKMKTGAAVITASANEGRRMASPKMKKSYKKNNNGNNHGKGSELWDGKPTRL